MYSAYKLNKQGNNIQHWHTSFPIWKVCCSMSSSNCCFLTCVQVSQEAGQVIWYSHLFQNFPQFIVIHTVKGFGIVNKAEINVFLEPSCFCHDPADVGNLICGSSAFSKTSLIIWKFTVHVLLKPGLENFEHYFTSVWDECNCVAVWAFFGIPFLGDWNENWPFPVLWPLLSFPNLLVYGVGGSFFLLVSICEHTFKTFERIQYARGLLWNLQAGWFPMSVVHFGALVPKTLIQWNEDLPSPPHIEGVTLLSPAAYSVMLYKWVLTSSVISVQHSR